MKSFLLKIWRLLPNSYRLRRSLLWPITQKFLVGVVGVVFNEQSEVLLLKHSYRRETPWGLPGGWLKKGEKPADAIVREIREETGFKIRVVRPLLINSDEFWPRLDIIFLCEFDGGVMTPSDEVTEAHFYAVGAMPDILPAQVSLIQSTFQALKKHE